jgi:hypothetical protein
MNIALGAVVIFILLIPPIAFYISYTFGKHNRGGIKFGFLDGILASAIFSLLIHGLAVCLIKKEIRFDIILKLLGGELKDLELKTNNSVLRKNLLQFAWYNFIVTGIMVALGQAARRAVRFRDWHWKFELLRTRNRWWYLFNGYYLNSMEEIRPVIDNPFVDAVVDTGKGTIIYSGYLVDFVCQGEDLDRIYLGGGVFRRELKKDGEEGASIFRPGDPKRIDGQFLCIPYSQIKNLNLKFITINLNDLEENEQANSIGDLDMQEETVTVSNEG